jgi:glycosyltransferase involved in cell wall biosynthesis
MTKKTVHSNTQPPPMPFVSVCTPTFNRRPFIPIMFECFRNQKYPKNRLEWIIIDDGTDKIKDLVDDAKIPQIKYYAVDKKMTLGAKRNMMHDKSKGSIIVYMDDDDYYPPERISHAVETLLANPRALCAGTSEIYLYFKQIKKMYQFGPYNPNHATAATFAFRRELINMTRYEDTACLAEERHFLKEYTIPFVQLDPMKTILVFSHEHNSFDKRKLLENPHPQFVKESKKTVDMFIRTKGEQKIKKFFIEDIDSLLSEYKPGEPAMKQDVLKQMREIEEERKKHDQTQQPQIMMQEPGKEPVAIGLVDAVNIINRQQQQLKLAEERIRDLESKNAKLQLLAEERSMGTSEIKCKTSTNIVNTQPSKPPPTPPTQPTTPLTTPSPTPPRTQPTTPLVTPPTTPPTTISAMKMSSEPRSDAPHLRERSKLEPEIKICIQSDTTSSDIRSTTCSSNKKSKLEPEFKIPI